MRPVGILLCDRILGVAHFSVRNTKDAITQQYADKPHHGVYSLGLQSVTTAPNYVCHQPTA